MKAVPIIGIIFITIALIFCAGCTGAQRAPPQSAAATTAPTLVSETAMMATPVPAATAYPGTLALNQLAAFGKDDRTGTATVYGVKILPNYSWSDPSFNSAHDQLHAGDTLFTTQYGYNTQDPSPGNVFVFAYVRVTDTGTKGIVAPSGNQFLLHYNGKDYAYSSIQGAQITVGNSLGPQYNYEYETGGHIGYILPGSSNANEGFLAYDVPATIDLTKAALVGTLDADHRAAWALV